MANGKNAGRLYADCEDKAGYGESHSFHGGPKPGDVVVCTRCHRRFIIDQSGHVALKPDISKLSSAEIRGASATLVSAAEMIFHYDPTIEHNVEIAAERKRVAAALAEMADDMDIEEARRAGQAETA
jgi:hypothetical protein